MDTLERLVSKGRGVMSPWLRTSKPNCFDIVLDDELAEEIIAVRTLLNCN